MSSVVATVTGDCTNDAPAQRPAASAAPAAAASAAAAAAAGAAAGMLMLSSLLVHRRLFLRDRDRTACDNTDCVATHSAADLSLIHI